MAGQNNPYHYNRHGYSPGNGTPNRKRPANGNYNGFYRGNNSNHQANSSPLYNYNGLPSAALSSPNGAVTPQNGTVHHGPNGFTPNQYRAARQRLQLPVYRTRAKIIDALKKDPTMIFVSETGSGKTTQIPQFIHDSKVSQGLSIAVTQPRRVAAISIAHRVADEMHCELGHLVGYSVRFDTKATDRTKIKFVTDGMLLREAILDPSLKRYGVIVLDEAHERSINTDLLFGVVKRAQRLRNEAAATQNGSGDGPHRIMTLRIVIMSATMDVDAFSEYFDNAPVYALTGREYQVRTRYISQPTEDYVETALITVFQIHLNEEQGDILVFCTGQEEIEAMMGHTIVTAQQLPQGSKKLSAFPLHASLPHFQQIRALQPLPSQDTRKVVFATNIAETSLTIPGIRYVVDTCKVKRRKFSAATGYEKLQIEYVSRAQATQRAGRAGRESAGICYRLMTEGQFQELPEHSVPEMLRCNLAAVVLHLIAIGIGDVRGFGFMDRPSEDNLNAALKLLERFKAIEPDPTIPSPVTYKLTALGSEMIQFPLDPRMARALVASKDLGCSEEILTIISMMSVETIFYFQIGKEEKAQEMRRKFQSTEGDHIQLLNIWKAWNATKCSTPWCKENFIDARSMRAAQDIHSQLCKLWEQAGYRRQSCGGQTETLRRCLARGYQDHMARLQRDGTYKSGKHDVHIHPSSCLLKLKPECILYSELVQTSKLYMRTLSVADPSWFDSL